jgi:EAL domain-containing protein (putative c-di-GMP-specific phosphodiesterase class I)
MEMLDSPLPIESDEHILRARRTAATTRVFMGAIGVFLILMWPTMVDHPALGVIGFATILISAAVQLAAPRASLLSVEEALSAGAGVLIIGFGNQNVDIVSVLWLVAVASGVLARGGRVHWAGRNILLFALLLPILRTQSVSADYAGLCLATLSLLLTSGRLTRELNLLLRQARLQAESAETLLLAGDIAARMTDREGEQAPQPAETVSLSESERAGARSALARLIQGDGLKMVVQPIVDIRTGQVHAFEALARFGEPRPGATPLHWFALAEQLGVRPALERACLREALALLPHRPRGTSLTVNLSAPVLLEAWTMEMLEQAADEQSDSLSGLIVEITEETLVGSDEQLHEAIVPLLARGVRLAVDDMGAGYSGLRQITTVHPSYLKLDKSLASGIDQDPERHALVAALSGYARQVGSLLIAEGIETTDELRALRRIGVPLVQGFRLGRPGEPWPDVDADDARGAGEAPLPASHSLLPEFLDPSDWPANEPVAERTRDGRRLTAV